MEHHLSENVSSVKNLNVNRYDCVTKLESLKDEFNPKVIN